MKDEYLITNHGGAYSSSTFRDGNTRKYHGLLVVSNPNLERNVVVNRLEEFLTIEGKKIHLDTNHYQDNVIQPEGFRFLAKHTVDPSVEMEYIVENIYIRKYIFLADRANVVKVRYLIESPEDIAFTISPLLTKRNFHSLRNFNVTDTYPYVTAENDVTIQLDEVSSLLVKTSSEHKFLPLADVYYNFFYPVEEERGYDAYEDLLKVGEWGFEVKKGANLFEIEFAYSDIESTSQSKDWVYPTIKFNHEESDELHKFKNFLERRADDFVVTGANRVSIIAGYHWFEDWGRDTFISFNGLLLSRGKYLEAKKLLLDWAKYIRKGLIPNRPGLKEYNSIDASLWYIVSVYNYWKKTEDNLLVQMVFPYVTDILQNLIMGTKFGIHMTKESFLVWTDSSKALTWMDAVIGGVPVTPRTIGAVEIQMLWYNVINMYREFEMNIYRKKDNYYLDLVLKTLPQTFSEMFWNEDSDYLYDSISHGKNDKSIRPNPVIGLGLPFSLLSVERSIKVLKRIESDLFTPLGLKTLDEGNIDFKHEFKGTQFHRDVAYHNGTVWPWLFGMYLSSCLKVNFAGDQTTTYVQGKLIEFWKTLNEKNLNYIPEVFSASTLEPNGCLSQAWNYATLLEVFDNLQK